MIVFKNLGVKSIEAILTTFFFTVLVCKPLLLAGFIGKKKIRNRY
jgi:hypothetical protein